MASRCLASLIPPPRFPWQRLSGVFGPRSPLRAAVVPRGPARAGATATLPRAKEKKRIAKTPDDASPFVASGEGTLPERGSDGEKAVRSRPRTSLGDGAVKPGGSRIAWAQLLRRIYWGRVAPGQLLRGPSQIRTCTTRASGSSSHGFAARGRTMCGCGSGYRSSSLFMRSQFIRALRAAIQPPLPRAADLEPKALERFVVPGDAEVPEVSP